MRVLKIGGNELSDPGFVDLLGRHVAHLRQTSADQIIIVHGGGRAIAGLQEQLGIAPVKVDGLRVTDLESLSVAQMVLSGHSNKIIVKALLAAGVEALGISGVDAGVVRCQRKAHPKVDLGYVGEVVEVRRDLMQTLLDQGLTIVLSPISLGLDGLTYNVNADEVAAGVAQAMDAAELTLISNVPGVLNGTTIEPLLTATRVEELITDGTISGGMIPKVRAALDVVQRGVAIVRITNLAGLLNEGGTAFVTGNGQEA